MQIRMNKFIRIFLVSAIIVVAAQFPKMALAAMELGSYITTISPTNGDVLNVGDSFRIEWESSSNIDQVSIGYKPFINGVLCESCLDWVANNIANTGSYNWDVSVGNTSNTQFLLEITGYETGEGSVTNRSQQFTVYSINTQPYEACNDCLDTDKSSYKVGETPQVSIVNMTPNSAIYWEFYLDDELVQSVGVENGDYTDSQGKFNDKLNKLTEDYVGDWDVYVLVGNKVARTSYKVSNSTVEETPTNIYKSGDNVKTQEGTVWFVTNTNCRSAYTSAGAFLSYGFNSWASVYSTTAQELSKLSICSSNNGYTLPREGKIICSDRGSDLGTCYLITGGKKSGFVSEQIFKGLGFSFANATFADVSWMSTGSNIDNSNSAHMTGVLVNNQGTVQLVTPSGLLGFPSMDVFNSWGYTFNDVVIANQADKNRNQSSVLQTRTAGVLSPY